MCAVRILISNWRDCKHPKAGGAEVLTEHVARWWVAWGHEVTLFTAAFPGGLAEETVEGVRIVRRGSEVSVYWEAFRFYSAEARNHYDFIVDEINALPFFTPLYINPRKEQAKHSFWIMHVCGKQWWYEARFPISLIGFFLERLSLRLYRRTPGMVLSPSTRAEMIRLGHREANLDIMPKGLSFAPLATLDLAEKTPTPTFISVGRVIRHKRIHHVIEAFRSVKRRHPQARLQIVGTGPPDYVASLHHLCRRLGLDDAVEFHGYVPEHDKLELLRRAHAHVIASIGEGWCLTVTEGNAMGTPAIVYDVKGLRDSVQHNQTGLVSCANTPESLAASMCEFLETPGMAARLTEACWRWSHTFSWESAARQTLEVMLGRVEAAETHTTEGRRPMIPLGVGPLDADATID
jgi:glycosyltransferase involved in cell wall biosynthesis